MRNGDRDRRRRSPQSAANVSSPASGARDARRDRSRSPAPGRRAARPRPRARRDTRDAARRRPAGGSRRAPGRRSDRPPRDRKRPAGRRSRASTRPESTGAPNGSPRSSLRGGAPVVEVVAPRALEEVGARRGRASRFTVDGLLETDELAGGDLPAARRAARRRSPAAAGTARPSSPAVSRRTGFTARCRRSTARRRASPARPATSSAVGPRRRRAPRRSR